MEKKFSAASYLEFSGCEKKIDWRQRGRLAEFTKNWFVQNELLNNQLLLCYNSASNKGEICINYSDMFDYSYSACGSGWYVYAHNYCGISELLEAFLKKKNVQIDRCHFY